MLLSRFLKAFPYPDKPEYLLVYSIKNSAMALVLQKDYKRLQKGEILDEYSETLLELGMLVDNLEHERQEVFETLAEVNRLDSGLNVSVILGMACNFACQYCYEGSLKGSECLDDSTVEQLITFLKGRYISRKKDRLILDFYGGEPLLYSQKIKEIAIPLKEFVEEHGGKFRFSLVTNGSLLTRGIAEELLPAGLYGAKITVDGPPDEHNRLRPFKSGQPSFDAILKNIKGCHELVRIGFGGNYTEENYTKVSDLLDIVEKEWGLTPENFGNVQFHPVMQTMDQFSNREFLGGCCSSNEPWLAGASVSVREEVLRRGYRTPKLNMSPCMVDLEDAFVVNHDGSIYKCVAMIGHEGYEVGNIWKGINNYKEIYNLNHWQQYKECRECEYLPLCFGGCRYMEFQRSGNMLKVDCMRDYWENVLEETVQQDANYR